MFLIVPVCFSFAVIKLFDHYHLEGGNGLFGLHFHVTVHHRGKTGTQTNWEAETETEIIEEDYL